MREPILSDRPSAESGTKGSRTLRIRWLMSIVLPAGALLIAIAVLNNNFSLPRARREVLASRLERAIQLGTNWLVENAPDAVGKPPLMYMVADMRDLSGDPRLRDLVTQSLNNPFAPRGDIWRRMMDESAQVRPPTRGELNGWDEYQRWMLYGAAPGQVELTDEERSHMFDRDRYLWGKRTHQLYALILYRQRWGNPEAVSSLINHLCEGIAFEADWDFRLTDLYFQRIAFVLAAGRPDLIKHRWIERILARQRPDGAWVESWYGWGPALFAFHIGEGPPTVHASVQALWSLYMLKYRYPHWVEQNSP